MTADDWAVTPGHNMIQGGDTPNNVDNRDLSMAAGMTNARPQQHQAIHTCMLVTAIRNTLSKTPEDNCKSHMKNCLYIPSIVLSYTLAIESRALASPGRIKGKTLRKNPSLTRLVALPIRQVETFVACNSRLASRCSAHVRPVGS